MDKNKQLPNKVNVMAVGLKRSEFRGLKYLFSGDLEPWRDYRLTQWSPMTDIDVILINAENERVMEKWKEIESGDYSPPVVYVCDEDSKVEDMDILINACFRPVRKTALLQALEAARAVADAEKSEPASVDLPSYQQPIAA